MSFWKHPQKKGEADHKPYGTLIRGAPFFGTLAHRTRIANCADSEIHGIDAMAMQIMMNPLPGASSSLKGQRFWVLVLWSPDLNHAHTCKCKCAQFEFPSIEVAYVQKLRCHHINIPFGSGRCQCDLSTSYSPYSPDPGFPNFGTVAYASRSRRLAVAEII